ncbi:hypothetical protein HAX54_014727, partial [Datura stramonium]|nr:hypothetical protein [Datura stramonium]
MLDAFFKLVLWLAPSPRDQTSERCKCTRLGLWLVPCARPQTSKGKFSLGWCLGRRVAPE